MPVWDAKNNPDVKEALNLSYEYEFLGERVTSGRYVECELSGGKILPTTLEARFHLSRLYLETGSIDTAEELLFAHEASSRHKPLSDDEKQILNAIALEPASGDIGSRTIRIRLRALYLLLRNAEQFNSEGLDFEDSVKVRALAEEYLARLGQIEPLALEDELFLMHKLKNELSTEISLRLAELSGKQQGNALKINPEEPVLRMEAVRPYGTLKPSLKARFRYFTARLKNTFPFDPTRVTYEDIQPYGKLIMDEIDKEASFKKGTKSGLVQAIEVMRLSSNRQVREFAQAMYSIYYTKAYKSEEDHAADRAAQVRQRIRRRDEEPIAPSVPASRPKRVQRDLLPIKELAAREGEFLQNTLNTYLTKSESWLVREDLEDTDPLFSEHSPEIKDNTIKQKFEQDAKDLSIAVTKLKETTYAMQEGKELSILRTECSVVHAEAEKELAAME